MLVYVSSPSFEQSLGRISAVAAILQALDWGVVKAIHSIIACLEIFHIKNIVDAKHSATIFEGFQKSWLSLTREPVIRNQLGGP